MAYIRMEVRCCCRPWVLLGHLQVPENIGSRLCVPMRSPEGEYNSFEVDILVFDDGKGHRYRAAQAHENDLPTLRRIRGFEEIDHGPTTRA